MKQGIPRVLIVDDDKENGEYLERELATMGCEATWFRDPRLALKSFKKRDFHVGILDLKMPHMSGVDLYHHLREKDPDLGIIILTGYPSVDSALATLKSGAFDYMKKPFKVQELKKDVQRLLEEKGFFMDADQAINLRIGGRIKDYRIGQRWTITKLAQKVQLSKSLISQLENGKNSASLMTLSRIARCLKVRVGDLVQDL